ncbi:hypothetical protein [Helicobacter cappadocius]|uniref:Uncharacterized protein n=1 Tax=Helicobacter cappadocius TaxID=3063998 RepID=A0AA90PRB9_9HELI|nr:MULTISPECIES: hypothetical protein [unclassified Helicobacter]MDO7253167.1 hypothetical protein [Helicobacter sp. faydin-H75]MDP2538707.1 hypothetical protein [Helicobacter sp. faydin-H76]
MKFLAPEIINKHHQILLSNTICYTNYFSLQTEYFYGKITQKSLIFLTKNSDFTFLYFTSIDLDDLEKLIAELPAEKIYLEIIQKGDISPVLKNILTKYFTIDGIYEKMTLYTKNLKSKLKDQNLSQSIQCCNEDELDFLYKNLCESFDSCFDHLPSKDTLLFYIQNKQVLIKRKNQEISAYCIFTLKGKTSHFNYLKNIDASSFEVIKLIEEYYEKMKTLQINHIYLWVDITKNIRVKNMHLRYGYQSSNIFNYAFIKNN